MMDINDKSSFLELLIKAYEGGLSPEEMRLLNERIKTDNEAAYLYAEFFDAVAGLVDISEMSVPFENDDSTGLDTWINFLAQDEKLAPAIEVPKEVSENVLIEKVVYAKSPRNISKLSIYSAIFSAAALLFIVLFIRFAPYGTKQEAATLTSSMNAEWGDIKYPMQNGTRLFTGKSPFVLQEGLAELLFDSNARVIIEGPAEFQMLDDDRIALRYGKIYATVPQEAIGFTVNAPSARIIDLGTEFGVEADTYGNTYLHMMKGKTTLIAGEKSNKISMEVSKGAAKKISGDTQDVTDIPCNEASFVRAFDPENKVVWRRQPSLDLADIAGKGNGLGTGSASVIIHPVKGYTNDHEYNFIKHREFLPLTDNPYMDGIFVPHGNPDLVVSTRGDVFRDAPKTSGLFSIDLVVNPAPGFYKTDLRSGAIEFNGQLYGDGGKPCITMHANVGLTFDLDALRQTYGRGINRFTARIGIADLNEPAPCNADFWVLVDGEVRYSLRQYKQKGVLNDVTVQIKDTDRFLTLMTTDGGDTDNPGADFYKRANSCDWCIFTEPILILE